MPPLPTEYEGTAAAKASRIGIMVDTAQGYGRSILEGVLAFSRKRPGWQLLQDGKPGLQTLQSLTNGLKIDGLICRSGDRAVLNALPELTQAVVLVASGPAESLPNRIGRVTVGNPAVGNLAFEYFRGLGFRHHALYGFSNLVFSSSRLEGYLSAAAKVGVEVHCHTLQVGGYEVNEAQAEDQLLDWVRGLPSPACVFAVNDITGAQVIRAALACGRHVPEEISVLGVDNDHLVCELTHPALSSIDTGVRELGYRAAEMLDAKLNGNHPGNPLRVIPPAGVVERASTDILVVADDNLRRAMRCIRERACDALTVAGVVEAAHMSRRALEIKFRDTFGRTLQEQITRTRVNRARDLLGNTNMLTPDIAAECGWPSASHMSVVFKRATGLTPSEFRRKAIGT